MIGLLLRLGTVLALGGAFVWGAHYGLKTLQVPTPTAVTPVSRSVDSTDRQQPLAPQPLSQFAETLRRPLFFEGRVYPQARPTVVEAPPPSVPPVAPVTPLAKDAIVAAPPTTDGLKLLGVMVVRGEARALVEAGPGQSEWLGVGKAVRDWTIERISTDRIVLRNGRRTAALDLYTLSPASPRSAPR